jgi:hypothetical protein
MSTEPLSVQISKNITIVQVANPLSEAEAGNNKTVLQIPPNPSHQNPPSAVLVNNVSPCPQKPEVVEQIGSSSQPTQTAEAVSLTPNSTAQFSLEDISKNPNDPGVGVVKTHDNIIGQYSDSVIQNPTDRTIIQYSDSAIHNPAVQTIFQPMLSPSTESNQTIFQLKMPQSRQLSAPIQSHPLNIFQNIFRTSGSFTSGFINITGEFFHSIWRKINLKQLQSRFHLSRQPEKVKTLEKLSSNGINRSTHNVIVSEEQPSSEQYQKKLRELDLCRISFAKELARNGKYRNAILIAEQIPETSSFFKDAQMLIKSCK